MKNSGKVKVRLSNKGDSMKNYKVRAYIKEDRKKEIQLVWAQDLMGTERLTRNI